MSAESVSPASGPITSTFTYAVNYTDADNNAPAYVRVFIDGTYYSMSKQTPGDVTYTDGCVYTYSRFLSLGSHSYYFQASDGYAINTTSIYQGPTVTAGPNQAPVLSAASVTPTSGTTNTTFTYAIVYSDPNDDAPSHVRVIIDDITFAMVKQNPADTTYTDGCTYVFSTTLGMGTHSYYFTASDGNATASTPVASGPIVTSISSNQPPVLVNGGVSPARGTPGTSLMFSVGYWDADNDAPESIFVYIAGSNYSSVAGSNYTMTKQQPGDMNYTDGCLYVASVTLPLGIHEYMFWCSCGMYGAATNISTVVVSSELISIQIEPSAPLANQTIFLSSTCTLGFGQVVTWSWDFGDGTPAVAGQNSTHVFAGTGTFTVVLSITTDYNVTAIAIRTIMISLDSGDGDLVDSDMAASDLAGLTIAAATIVLLLMGTVTATKRRYTRTNARIGKMLESRGRYVNTSTSVPRDQQNVEIEVLLAEARRRQLSLLPNTHLKGLLKEYHDATERPALVERAAVGEIVARARDAMITGKIQDAAGLVTELRASIIRATIMGIFSAPFKKEADDAVMQLIQLASSALDKCKGQLDATVAKHANGYRQLLQLLGTMQPRRPSDRLLDALSSIGRTTPRRS
ncbi:MAG: PKD domain-containing protein [Candidatus Lokiarchaeota archaeon]|nr:PKD domain-containing protein [Candidatus Lokiarchaeota archaeon]